MVELTREAAYDLLAMHNRDESHIKHAIAVEAAMKYFARLFGEDENLWGIVGLLHDLDWEECPEEHPKRGAEWLREAGYPDYVVRGVLAHAWEITGVEPNNLMEKVIYAVDELTGFVIAVALVRPSRSLSDLTTKSVMKKWKDKAFAKGVNREVIQKGADLLDMPLNELIDHVIKALRPIERELGLG